MITRPLATAAFEASGLDAMGIASGQLAAQWAEAAPTFDATAMTLTCSGPAVWHAPAGGMLHWSGFGAPDLTDAEGRPLELIVAVLRLHPQTVLRLHRLIGARFDGRTDGRAARPVPVCAAIRDGQAPSGARRRRRGRPAAAAAVRARRNTAHLRPIDVPRRAGLDRRPSRGGLPVP